MQGVDLKIETVETYKINYDREFYNTLYGEHIEKLEVFIILEKEIRLLVNSSIGNIEIMLKDIYDNSDSLLRDIFSIEGKIRENLSKIVSLLIIERLSRR